MISESSPGHQAPGWEPRQEGTAQQQESFTTVSGLPVAAVYAQDDLAGSDLSEDIGRPGEYPFTRGIHPTMYRGRLWTMRQFAGFGTARDTNERFRFLLEQGQTGLSVAFDLPTLMGIDSDDPRAAGEVGRCGVAIDSLEDMRQLFAGIPLAEVTTSMTISSPAPIALALYLAVAEEQGIGPAVLGGTLQTDILKEYIAQNEYIFPPTPSMRLVRDLLVYCTAQMPRWNPISISGYHIREAGSTAIQELAFTLANGMAYVELGLEAGLEVDAFAPRLSFFFNAHIDFFEEIAKYRAARRIWARAMRERFGAVNPRSWMLRFHAQTAGCSLTAQQPENNITRTALEALSAVLGGAQSLHTNALDEVLALPTERTAQIALRTQQIIAHEIGVTNTVDPLAGSYFVEALTNRMEQGAHAYFRRIEEQGGVIAALENGFLQAEIASASCAFQQAVEQGRRVVVGVNRFTRAREEPMPLLNIDPQLERSQRAAVQALRERRDNLRCTAALQGLEDAARGTGNIMPALLAAVKAYATEGEMVEVLARVFGRYREPAWV